ncbi:diguanylate cyclase [Neobacillus sp.]|uniref:diguanylate cyclase n=1 Tax=Neobacillus sp. TaxID=2675273 RepID=UPI0028969650|nr:diguanylate cyclase [Neobacillus sp.]
MELNKYKNLLFQKIKKQISVWFEAKNHLQIANSEVFLFLHSIHGSSGTLQLEDIHQLSGKLMNQIEKLNHKHWEQDELRNFLDGLISLSYENEYFVVVEKNKELRHGENVPLIQIIDDDVSMLILLKDALEEKGWMVVANTSPEKAISQYFDLNPDCVIIDINLPNINGFQVLDDLQQHNNKQFVPKIMISILNDRKTRINAYKIGADDYIEKPIDLEELTVRIERLLNRKKLFDQSVLLDELTQLYNRKFLMDVFKRNLKELKWNEQIFSIAILDLDHFKQINDTFGHLTGDKVLFTFANFLKENIRSSDTAFRYGGEEFVILFENTSQTEAVEIISRLLKEFSVIQFEKNKKSFTVTFSTGVVTIHQSETTMEAAIKAADQALYKAKENGRARVETMDKPSLEITKKPLFVSIIDDDVIIRTMLMRILKMMDFDHFELNLEAFEDGIQFFNSPRLEEVGEHFLILDGVMPVMDGIEILQKVKKNKNGRNIRVLMLTGRKSESDIERALKLGADDYVTKPFSIKELQARIHRLIKRMK